MMARGLAARLGSIPVVLCWLAAAASSPLPCSAGSAGSFLSLAPPSLHAPSASSPVPTLTGSAVQSAQELYERAYFREQGQGDLEGAIELYSRIAAEHPRQREVVARALLRMGICYERLGFEGAEAAYRRILDEYGDVEETVRLARQRLEALNRARSLLDVPTGIVLRQVVLPDGSPLGVRYAALSPDRKRLAVEADDGGIDIHDLETDTTVRVMSPGPEEGSVWGFRWSPDGRRLAFAWQPGFKTDPQAWAFDLDEGRRRRLFRGRDYGLQYSWELGVSDWTPDGREVLLRYVGDDDVPLAVLVDLEGEVVWERELPVDGWGLRISPRDGTLAMVATHTEGDRPHDDIFLWHPERGGAAVPVAHSPESDAAPAWSPDGRHLAFASTRAAGWGLWAVELVGGEPAGDAALLRRGLGFFVAGQDWLPDGSLVMYEPREDMDVWVLPVDPATGQLTDEPFQPVQFRGTNTHPAFSYDGRRIAFRSRQAEPGVYILALDEEVARHVEVPFGYGGINPRWRPDGRIWFIQHESDGDNVLVEHDPRNGTSRAVPFPFELRGTPIFDFSPDGERVVFNHRDPAGPEVGRLWVWYPESGQLKRLPIDADHVMGKWSPTGEWIAAMADSTTILLVRPDGSERRVLLHYDDMVLNHIDWGPRGRNVVFTYDTPQGRELRVVSLDGGPPRVIEGLDDLRPWWLDWSAEGRHIVVSTVETHQSLWILEGLRVPLFAEQASGMRRR